MGTGEQDFDNNRPRHSRKCDRIRTIANGIINLGGRHGKDGYSGAKPDDPQSYRAGLFGAKGSAVQPGGYENNPKSLPAEGGQCIRPSLQGCWDTSTSGPTAISLHAGNGGRAAMDINGTIQLYTGSKTIIGWKGSKETDDIVEGK